jgi:fucose 4-O-acetylase-like acetyltransferase
MNAPLALPSRLLSLFLREVPPRAPTGRMVDLDAARGVAIFLVVLGHVVAEEMPRDVPWYPVLKFWIYRFHMPLFMVLTGVTFSLSLPHFKSWSEVLRFSWRKTSRLLVPYVFFGLLVLAGKIAASRYLHVDNVPMDPAASALNLLWRPGSSAAGFLWFIYVLAVYFMTLPALVHLLGRRPFVLMTLGLVLGLFRWSEVLSFGSVVYYLPWFAAGMAMWIWRAKWQALPFKAIWALLLPWLVLSVWLSMNTRHRFPIAWVGALSVPLVLGLVQQMPERWQEAWAWIGQRSLALYLMNTVVIGLTKALFLKAMPWDGLNFYLYFTLALTAGMVLPLIVKEVVSRRLPALNNYV